MNSQHKKRKLNNAITKSLIDLHGRGYDLDFLLSANGHIKCVQNDHDHVINAVSIGLADKAYDRLTRGFKYIHTIDTGNRHKGVLLTDTTFIDDSAS